MASVNKVILLGRLGRDPEVKTFQNGGRVCNMSIATSESWKDKSTGERKERTEWHSVAIFSDGLVGVAERFLKKGNNVYLEGKLQTRKWQDQNGNDKYTTEVVLQGYDAKLVLIDKPSSGGTSSRDSSWNDQTGGGGARKGNWEEDLDEEIPF